MSSCVAGTGVSEGAGSPAVAPALPKVAPGSESPDGASAWDASEHTATNTGSPEGAPALALVAVAVAASAAVVVAAGVVVAAAPAELGGAAVVAAASLLAVAASTHKTQRSCEAQLAAQPRS